MQLNYLKSLLFISCCIFMSACNDKQRETTASAAKPAEQQNSVAEVKNVEQPQAFFNGRGFNPDWKMSIWVNNAGVYEVTIKKGDNSEIVFNAQKEPLYTDGKVNASSGEVKLSGKTSDGTQVTISLLAGECTDAEGNKYPHSCKVLLGKETLKGCGEYQE